MTSSVSGYENVELQFFQNYFFKISSDYFVCCGRCWEKKRHENLIFVEKLGTGHLGRGLYTCWISIRQCFRSTEVSAIWMLSLWQLCSDLSVVGHPVGSGVGGGSQRCLFLLLMEWVKAIGRGLISHARNRLIQIENRIIAPLCSYPQTRLGHVGTLLTSLEH